MTLETTGVHILFRDLYLERPPKVRLYMDVWLDNAPDQPRWFLLPDEVSGEREGPARRISSLQVYELRDNGRVWVGHFCGEGGFQALLLPPGAHVVLRGFPVLYWGEIPDAVDLEVIPPAIAGQMCRRSRWRRKKMCASRDAWTLRSPSSGEANAGLRSTWRSRRAGPDRSARAARV